LDGKVKTGADHLGLLVLGSTVVAALCWGLAELTAGDVNGGRYDVDFVNYVAWFALILFGLLAVALAVVGALRPLERRRQRRRARLAR
jgi:membrane protein DedA with SNARE-associated domain